VRMALRLGFFSCAHKFPFFFEKMDRTLLSPPIEFIVTLPPHPLFFFLLQDASFSPPDPFSSTGGRLFFFPEGKGFRLDCVPLFTTTSSLRTVSQPFLYFFFHPSIDKDVLQFRFPVSGAVLFPLLIQRGLSSSLLTEDFFFSLPPDRVRGTEDYPPPPLSNGRIFRQRDPFSPPPIIIPFPLQ